MPQDNKNNRPAHVQHFISQHLNDAQIVSCTSGIPVSVILAQSALETGWGIHVKSGAYFGIKGHSPSGASVRFTTHEQTKTGLKKIKAEFRSYNSYLDAAKDYAHVIETNYTTALAHKDNPLEFVEHLKSWATDTNYSKKLKAVIESEKLQSYDDNICKGVKR